MERQPLWQHRILFLAEPLTPVAANSLVAGLLLLDAEDPAEPIDLYVNCPGGSVLDGLALIDTMRCIQAPVSTVCLGQATAIAAWVLAAGEPGQRRATENAEVLLHQVAAQYTGAASDICIHADRVLRLQERLVRMLAEWTHQDADQIREEMRRDHFLTAEEALVYGLIDEVVEPKQRAHGLVLSLGEVA